MLTMNCTVQWKKLEKTRSLTLLELEQIDKIEGRVVSHLILHVSYP